MGTRTSLPLRFPASFFAATLSAQRLAAVRRLIRAAVPTLADFALVYLSRPSAIDCIAAAHATPTGTRLLRALVRAYRVRRTDRDSTVAHVIRTMRPIIRTDIAVEFAADHTTGGERDSVANLHRRLRTRSALAVPVVGAGSVLGALTLCYSDSDRSYRTRDIATAMRLATRIGRALIGSPDVDATVRLRAAARNARQGTTFRRRVAARDQI